MLAELVDLTPRHEGARIELPAGDELREALAEVERMVADVRSATAVA